MAAKMELGELIWKISGDTADIKKKLGETEKGTKKLGSGFKKFAGIAATALAAVGIAKFTKEIILAASAAEETQAKFNTAFKGIEEESTTTATVLAKNYGLSNQASKQLLAGTGDLLKGFGASASEALSFSNKIQELSVDLASYNNVQGGTKRVSRILTKSVLGNKDGLSELGVVLTDTAIKQELVRRGQDDLSGQALLLAKSEATFKLILEQTGDAMGDFNRTQDSFANQSRVASARVEDLKVSLGQNLLPIAGLGIKTFNNMSVVLMDAASSLNAFTSSSEGSSIIGETLGVSMGVLATTFEILKPLFSSILGALKDMLLPLKDLGAEGESTGFVFTVLGAITQGISSTLTILGKVVGFLVNNLKNFVNIILESGQVLGDLFGLITGKTSFKEFKKSVAETGDAIKKYFTDGVNGVVDITKTAFTETTGLFNNSKELSQKLEETFKNAREKTKKAVTDSLRAQQEEQEAANQAELDALAEQEKLKQDIKDEAAALALEKQQEALLEQSTAVFDYTSEVMNSFVSMSDSIGGLLTALTAVESSEIESRKKAELKAAGFATKTALQEAKAELKIAKAQGDQEAIDEANKNVKLAEINEKYAKEQGDLAYRVANIMWGLQLSTAIATGAAAVVAALLDGLSVPGPAGIALGAVASAAAATASGVQIATIALNKPKRENYAEGGIVPGNDFVGDRIQANVNSGELILNKEQQSELYNIAKGDQVNNNETPIEVTAVFNVDGVTLAEIAADVYNRGVVLLNLDRAAL